MIGELREKEVRMGMYLYEAMIEVLIAGGNVPMTVEDITESIINQALYLKKNGLPPDAWDVGARAVSDIQKSGVPMFDVLVKLRDKRL